MCRLQSKRCIGRKEGVNTADKPKRREFAQLRSGLGPVLLAALDNRSTVEIKLNADGKLWRERLGCPMWEIGSMIAARPKP
jgi:hypothetical protein